MANYVPRVYQTGDSFDVPDANRIEQGITTVSANVGTITPLVYDSGAGALPSRLTITSDRTVRLLVIVPQGVTVNTDPVSSTGSTLPTPNDIVLVTS